MQEKKTELRQNPLDFHPCNNLKNRDFPLQPVQDILICF